MYDCSRINPKYRNAAATVAAGTDALTRLPKMTNSQIPEVTPTALQKSQKQLQLAK